MRMKSEGISYMLFFYCLQKRDVSCQDKLAYLEHTSFKKISSNPKIGIFCDVTAYRIFLF